MFMMVKSMAIDARTAQKATHKKIGTPRIKKPPVIMEMIQIAHELQADQTEIGAGGSNFGFGGLELVQGIQSAKIQNL